MTLPVYKIEPAKRRGYVKVTCPRSDCGGSFWVHRVTWIRSRPDHIGRSCPFCYKASAITNQRRTNVKA